MDLFLKKKKINDETIYYLYDYLNDEYVFFNSDAHYLEAISEPENQFDREKFYQLWRK